MCEAAGLHASFPADAAVRAWKAEETHTGINCFGGQLSSLETDGPRGAIAAAMGLAMTGLRATVFVSGPDLMSAQDLLVMAAGQHLPLVVHLGNRTLAAQAGALGTGHKAYHSSADTGFFVLLAANVQEAADFTLIARRVAERALIPGLVAMDGEQTALALQDVCLPEPALLSAFLGPPDALIAAPTPAQRMLFGERRRCMPRWHDLDQPVLHGALQGPESWALGAVGKHPYFDQHLPTILEQSLREFARLTGRTVDTLSSYRLADATLVLAAQGSAIETAQAVADYARQRLRLRVGVLGVHGLRPFPGARIAECLRGKRMVAVLERVDTPLVADPPLTRQLRAAVDRALGSRQLGSHADAYPVMAAHERPRFRSVIYGLGGLPLRAADLLALCQELAHEGAVWGRSRLSERLFAGARKPQPPTPSRIYLGFDFARASSSYPKRQVVLDRLRRDYPDIAKLGLVSHEAGPDLRPKGAFTLAVHRLSGQGGEGLAAETATLLHRLLGGQVRSRPGLFWGRFQAYCVDRFTSTAQPSRTALRDPGDQIPVDVAIVTTARHHERMRPIAELRQEGALLLVSSIEPADLWQTLPVTWRQAIQRKHARCYHLSPLAETQRLSTPGLSLERLLGGTLAVLAQEGWLALPRQRIVQLRQVVLQPLPSAEREQRLIAFSRGFEDTIALDYEVFSHVPLASSRAAEAAEDDEAPLAVRHLARGPDGYASLPRFWDQVGALYRHGDAEELSPDPYLATGVVPSLTATFRSLSDSREWFPVFDPSRCTGCGQCWTRCPDSAIAVVAINPSALIEAGIRIAGAHPLRPLVTKLARRIVASARARGGAPCRTLLADALAGLAGNSKLVADHRTAVASACDALLQKLGPLPLAITAPLFHEREAQRPGTGALLALIVDPDTCKGCGLCLTACHPGALSAAAQDDQRIADARRLMRLWEQLPDTPSTTIDSLRGHPILGALAPILLSRHCLLALAGGDGAEAGSGEKALVRLLLAVTEFMQKPSINRLLEETAALRQAVMGLIRDTLADPLPTHDLDALASSVERLQTAPMALASLSELLGTTESASLDVAQLRRLIGLAKELSQFHWRLAEGSQGMGRARLAVAVAPGSVASWAGAYPYNPFHVPVAIDMTGATAPLAAGLLEGQLREATEGLLLLRRARAELARPGGSGFAGQWAAPRQLSWNDLKPEERAFCPPLYLIGNNDILGGRGLGAVLWLLSGEAPIKIVILSHLDLSLDTTGNLGGPPGGIVDTLPSTAKTPNVHLGFLALLQRRAFVAQTCMAEPNHLFESIQQALSFPGPALIHVHAPSPEHHGFATDQTFTRASEAVRSRAFPLFRYDPRANGIFPIRLQLDGNPQPEAPWVRDDAGEAFTPAHWALAERRFARYFVALKPDDPAPVPLSEYLELEASKRAGKTPFVTNTNEQGSVRYRVDAALVSATEARLAAWRTLQELAGIVTPFTDWIEQRVEQRLRSVYETERRSLTQIHEHRLRAAKAESEAEIAARIEARLLALAGYASNEGEAKHLGQL